MAAAAAEAEAAAGVAAAEVEVEAAPRVDPAQRRLAAGKRIRSGPLQCANGREREKTRRGTGF